MITSRMPAINVARTRPSIPYFWTTPYTITTKAPVGPPICTRLPPSTDTRKPAMIAVKRPLSGDTPEAIANAIAKGMATTPTTNPAIQSFKKTSFE